MNYFSKSYVVFVTFSLSNICLKLIRVLSQTVLSQSFLSSKNVELSFYNDTSSVNYLKAVNFCRGKIKVLSYPINDLIRILRRYFKI